MKYLMCNLKANNTYQDMEKYVKNLKNKELDNVVVFPSNMYLAMFSKTNISFGSQDISRFRETASTGEMLSDQIKSLNASYVIVGHSERRNKNNEDEKVLLEKINNALDSNLKVVYCIGETKEQKMRQKTYQVLEKQLAKIFNNLPFDKMNDIIIAYEPVWAIGKGVTPTKEEINEIVTFIKKIINDYYDINIKVLYGGSVNLDNIEALNKIKKLDGFLVGGASNNSDNVLKMAQLIK